MSDLPGARQLKRANPQLPVAWYFVPEVFAVEQRRLFAAGPNYMGHEQMVPNVGDYHTLAWMEHARVLVRNAGGVELLSNVCRHRQSVMLEGRGHVDNIVCPLHRWTYDLQGQLLGAPHFETSPCQRLQSTPLSRWQGLLFAGPADAARALAGVPALDWDFSGYVLDRVTIEEYDVNWKTFLEAYLELYHVEACHPGLGNFADTSSFRVDYGADWSVQVLQAKSGLGKPGTPAYRTWQAACLKQLAGRVPRQGALWMTYFPGLMLEWYPNVLVVSQLIPRSPTRTTNVVEFYYPEDIALFEREFVEAQQAAYAETAIEDNEICLRLDRGRRALWRQGMDDAGPYQSPMEDTMVHFHEWLRHKLDR
jgi:phenylpropionate dioxygenase-like ring-hydroxylating dioxygenase large terminal subunit